MANRIANPMTIATSLLFCVIATLTACGGGSSPTPPAPPVATAQSLCAAFNGQVFNTADGNATVTNASLIAMAGTDPEYCRVQGSMPPALHFEVKLPTQWNQRVLYIGGGGFDGAIPQPPGYEFSQGYVTVASDGGHPLEAGTENWALDAEQLKDFADRSVHKTLTAARLMVQQRYGQAAMHSYFEGCSNGGREALMQAQRYPNDFDGIIARAPAWNFTELMLAGNKSAQQFFGSAASQLSTAKIATLSNAVLAACDTVAVDGVADGIISNPARCTFNPSSLRCTGADNDSCLTDAQIATVTTIYSPFRLNNGVAYYIGWPAGGESDPVGWPFWVASQNNGLPSFSTRFIQYFLGQNPVNFVPDNNLQIIADRAALIDAASTDYSAFRAHNGKLILWHGTTDWAISYYSTALYYGNVVQAAGGQTMADQFVEFFPAPGVQHCSGGVGPDFVDLLKPLRNWVEGGPAPSQQSLNIVKFNPQFTAIINSRPLCKYPLYPRYSGSGDQNLFSNYSCVVP